MTFKKFNATEKIKRHLKKIRFKSFKKRMKGPSSIVRAIAVRSFLIVALAAIMVVVLRPQMESIFTAFDSEYYYCIDTPVLCEDDIVN